MKSRDFGPDSVASGKKYPIKPPVSPNAGSADYPNTEALATAINEGLVRSHGNFRALDITQRHRWVQESSSLMEVVTCSDGLGITFDILCKYGGRFTWGEWTRSSHGHRGSVRYEALVYEQVLHGSDGPPRYEGKAVEPASGEIWLFLEYVEGAVRLAKTPDWRSMITKAAAWIGSFHRSHQVGGKDSPRDWMLVHDVVYLKGWLERTIHSWKPRGGELLWLDGLSDTFDAWASSYRAVQPVIIHGEYYPKNILVNDDRVVPVDWESAAVGLGEVDVVTLVENWGREVEEECWSAYAAARYDAGLPVDFDTRVNLARLYVQLRWLGDPSRRYEDYRLPTLRLAAEQLGVLG